MPDLPNLGLKSATTVPGDDHVVIHGQCGREGVLVQKFGPIKIEVLNRCKEEPLDFSKPIFCIHCGVRAGRKIRRILRDEEQSRTRPRVHHQPGKEGIYRAFCLVPGTGYPFVRKPGKTLIVAHDQGFGNHVLTCRRPGNQPYVRFHLPMGLFEPEEASEIKGALEGLGASASFGATMATVVARIDRLKGIDSIGEIEDMIEVDHIE